MPLRIENPEAARFRAQSAELYRQPQTGGGQPYQNPDAYHHFTLPTMVKEGTFKPTAEILGSGKPLFYTRFPGNELFTPAGAAQSPCNLSLLDTLSVQRAWCVREHQDVMKWTVGKRFSIRHKKFDRPALKPSLVQDGVSKVETACERDTEFLRFPVKYSTEDMHQTQVVEELDSEVKDIMYSTSKKTGDVRHVPEAMIKSPSSPIPPHRSLEASRTMSLQDKSRSFQTPGLMDPGATQTGFNTMSKGLPFINFGKDKFALPKWRRPLPEVGFNKYGPVKPPE